MAKQKILIDTDIGDDIDDAFALLLAANMKLDIVGVTTVFKNTVERARMAKKLLKLCGAPYADTPVYAGIGKPLCGEVDLDERTCQYSPDLEDEIYTPDNTDPEAAIDFILDCCRKYGDELTIVAIGPFTNIAAAIKKDAQAISRANIVIMGGAYFRQYADWNVWCDPHAAKLMFESTRGIRCLGADVTHKLRLTPTEDAAIVNYRGDNAAAGYVSQLYKYWKGGREWLLGMLHDPLTVLCAVDPTYCEYKSAPVAVVTEGVARGMTVNIPEYGKARMNGNFADFDFAREHSLAHSVDRDAVIARFMRCFER